jgi:hypothetical protein
MTAQIAIGKEYSARKLSQKRREIANCHRNGIGRNIEAQARREEKRWRARYKTGNHIKSSNVMKQQGNGKSV